MVARTIVFKAPREKFFGKVRQVLNYLFKDRSSISATPALVTVKNTGSETVLPVASNQPVVNPAFEQFCTVVDEDFNFAGGLAVLFELAKDLGKAGNILTHGGQIADSSRLKQQWYSLQQLAAVVGLEAQLVHEPVPAQDGLDDQAIEKLIAERKAARTVKDFKKGDKIRNDLKAQGIVLVDQKGAPTTWYRS